MGVRIPESLFAVKRSLLEMAAYSRLEQLQHQWTANVEREKFAGPTPRQRTIGNY